MTKFILKETYISIKKAKGSFVISLAITSISIFLITASYFLYDLSGAVQKKLKSNIILNVFLYDSLNSAGAESLVSKLHKLDYIAATQFISKSQAAEIFIKETGEDFRKIIEYNPLPASIQVKIKEDSFSPSLMKKAVEAISIMDGVEEVVYGNEAAERIYYFVEGSKRHVLTAALVLIFISIYIVYSTSKLILKTRADEIETIKLIGAKLSAVKIPVVLHSVLTGIIAGGLSFIIFSLFINSTEAYISQFISYNFNYFLLLGVTVLAGPFLGGLISYFTLRKITLKI